MTPYVDVGPLRPVTLDFDIAVAPVRSARGALALGTGYDRMGEPDEHLDAIFDAFHRVLHRVGADAGGFGLGRALAKRVVDRRHCDIGG